MLIARRPWLLILGGGFLVLLSAGAILLGTPWRPTEAAPLPERLSDLALTQSLVGAEASAALDRLHAGDIRVASAAVGRYGKSGEATLWVAGAPTAWQAGQMLRAMNERIRTVDTPFRPDGEEEVAGLRVSRLLGMGQRHYVFQANRYLVWLSVDPILSERTLRAAVEAYR